MSEKPKRLENDSSEKPLFTRRDVLIGAGASIVGTGAISTGPTLLDIGQEVFNKEDLAREVSVRVQEIQERYGIMVRFDESLWPEVESQELYEAAKVRTLRYLQVELRSYPKALFRPLPFSSVTFRNDLQHRKYVQDTVEGFYNSDVGLILDIGDRGFGWSEREDFHSNFSHEFFHAIDTIDDDVWLQRFPPPAGTSFSADIADRVIPGYVSGYGLLDSREDRAAIYAALATSNRDFLHRLDTDDVLAAKTNRIQDYMTRISGGLIDSEYWQQRNQKDFSDRAEDYFQEKARKLIAQSYGEFSTLYPSLAVDTSQETYERWQQEAREDYLS